MVLKNGDESHDAIRKKNTKNNKSKKRSGSCWTVQPLGIYLETSKLKFVVDHDHFLKKLLL